MTIVTVHAPAMRCASEIFGSEIDRTPVTLAAEPLDPCK